MGYLGISPSTGDLEPFRQGLRELGWAEGQNITIEYRWTGGRPERVPELVTELIRLSADVIYTPGSVAAAQAAKRATTTTPANPVHGPALKAMEGAAQVLGVQHHPVKVAAPGELEGRAVL